MVKLTRSLATKSSPPQWPAGSSRSTESSEFLTWSIAKSANPSRPRLTPSWTTLFIRSTSRSSRATSGCPSKRTICSWSSWESIRLSGWPWSTWATAVTRRDSRSPTSMVCISSRSTTIASAWRISTARHRCRLDRLSTRSTNVSYPARILTTPVLSQWCSVFSYSPLCFCIIKTTQNRRRIRIRALRAVVPWDEGLFSNAFCHCDFSNWCVKVDFLYTSAFKVCEFAALCASGNIISFFTCGEL